MKELLENYQQIKEKLEYYSSKLEKVKKKIKSEVEKMPKQQFETKDFSISVKSINRQTISKKSVPIDIWKKYSLTSTYSQLNIKDKLKKTKRS